MNTKKLIDDLRICADDDIICPACERYDKMGVMGGTAECVSKLLLEAAAALEEQQKRIAELEKERRWIPVTERVPEKSTYVLCYWHGHICRCKFWRHHSRFEFNGRLVKVTHWMPLPKPPKEE